jgi:hypothetical protein
MDILEGNWLRRRDVRMVVMVSAVVRGGRVRLGNCLCWVPRSGRCGRKKRGVAWELADGPGGWKACLTMGNQTGNADAVYNSFTPI